MDEEQDYSEVPHEIMAERLQLGSKRLEEIAEDYLVTVALDVSPAQRKALVQAEKLVGQAIDALDATFGPWE